MVGKGNNPYQKLDPNEEVSILSQIASAGESNPNITFVPKPDVKDSNWRDNLGFWICGLINNFGYVVMLSAATDILPPNIPPAVVLLAQIVPALLLQLIAPYFQNRIPYQIRIIVCVALDVSSFLIVAFFEQIEIKIIGIIFGAIGSGFGELTFLAYSSRYHKNTVSAWSSGTGGAGILGSFSYLGLTYVLTPKETLLISSPAPLAIAVCYFFLITKPAKTALTDPETASLTTQSPPGDRLHFKQQLVLTAKIMPYMIPLGLVYFGEYLINQSVTGVLTFPNDKHFSNQDTLYKWYQAIYQVGVFISRSSVKLLPIKSVFLLQLPAVFQTINLLLLSFVAIYDFIPSVYVIFCIILWEGFLGGSIYVNTFYLLSQRFEGLEKEFCMGACSQSYGVTITAAGIIGLFYGNVLKAHSRRTFSS